MDMATRQAMIERQREYVASPEGQCPHIIQCAVTPEQVANALEIMRRGNAFDSALGAASLSGPCRPLGREN